jgi:uncharacterized protein with FMN-binding domain
MIKKLFLSLAVIFGFGLYAYGLKQSSRAASPAIVPTANDSSSGSTPTNNTQTTPPPSNMPMTTTPMPMHQTYNNGTYTSSVEDAFYGNVQIRTTIKAGQITDVQFLQYPNDRGNSIEINNYAMPILKQEAITAQSAQVDIVSGATATSEAFQRALDNTLIQARA